MSDLEIMREAYNEHNVASLTATKFALEAEVARLRGIVAAVEALPKQWREVIAFGGNPYHVCADELGAAIGEAK